VYIIVFILLIGYAVFIFTFSMSLHKFHFAKMYLLQN